MIKIGITGGIGSGKSVVSSLLEIEDIPVYKADDESKRLTDTSLDIRKEMQAFIDDSIYINDRLDRQRLASLIFNDEALLKKVNGIIHPAVKKDFNEWVTKQVSEICALESAILFESGFEKEVDVVVLVYAPVELRLWRVIQRDGMSEAEVIKRMNSQLPDEQKREKADFVIINDDLHPLIPQIENFLSSPPLKGARGMSEVTLARICNPCEHINARIANPREHKKARITNPREQI